MSPEPGTAGAGKEGFSTQQEVGSVGKQSDELGIGAVAGEGQARGWQQGQRDGKQQAPVRFSLCSSEEAA